MAYFIDELVKDAPQVQIGHRWYIAKAVSGPFICRLKDAIGVLTGRYDAVKFAAVEAKKDPNYKPLLTTDQDVADAVNTANKQAIETRTGYKFDENNNLNVGRNEPCICGSGLKYKRCCGKDE